MMFGEPEVSHAQMPVTDSNGAHSMSSAVSILPAALWYANHGFPIFPVHSGRDGRCSCADPGCKSVGKHPKTFHGFKDATKDQEQINTWWRKWPDANIGLATGAVSGLLVLDIDPRNGGAESWEELVEQQDQAPDTAEQLTGGGGRHIFFRNVEFPVPKELAPGIDVKGTGGYVIVAPSIHNSGRSYTWDGKEGAEALLNVAPVPDWLCKRLVKAGERVRQDAHSKEKWSPGGRNAKLASLAGSMRSRGMSLESIELALLEENRQRCEPPLSDGEVRKIAASIASYEPGDKPASKAVASGATGFRLTEEGVMYLEPDETKDPLIVCSRLEVAALSRDGNGEGWGRLLRWVDAEKRTHQWSMPMSLLAGDGSEYRGRLLDGGLVIAPGRKARDLLTTYIQTAKTRERVLCVSCVGWNGESFVLPNETLGGRLGESVVFQTPHESDHLLNVSGTLEEWRDNVGLPCRGNTRLVLAVSCALAGPLLSLAGIESGGIHFVGSSSTGKSTTLYVGGSVLGGGGRAGFVRSWRTTANGLEASAESHNDLTLFLDELAQLDPREAAEIAYLLANGSGKSRMSRTFASSKRLTWRLLFVSSGEITLSDHARTAGQRVRAGAEVRLLNIDADAGAGMGAFENLHGASSAADFANRLKQAAIRYYGTPVRALLHLIIRERQEVLRALPNFRADFLTRFVPAGASGEVVRAAQRFAVIAAAGELASGAGITGWDPDEATTAAARCFQSWMERRGSTQAGDIEAALRRVRQFLEAHGSSRFQPVQSGHQEQDRQEENAVLPNRAGFRRVSSTTQQIDYLFLPEVFRAEVCAGHDCRLVLRALNQREFLIRDTSHWTIKPRQLPGMPAGARVYCIRGAILEQPE